MLKSSIERLALTFLLAFVCAALPSIGRTAAQTGAFTVEQEQAIDAINARLNQLGSLQGTFIQTGPNGEMSEGRVFIRRPGKMRFEYNMPHPILIVADGRWVAIEDRKAKTTDQYPLKLTPLRLILGKNVNLREDAAVIALEQSDETVLITVEESDGNVPGRLSMLFNAQDYTLLQWTVTDAQGLNTSVALYDTVEGQSAPDKLFYINQNIFPDAGGGNR